jgi:hypothetical protein
VDQAASYGGGWDDAIRQQIEWIEASRRNLARASAPAAVELDRDARGNLIIWRENRVAVVIWLAVARCWELGAIQDQPIAGLDRRLALELADRMAADHPEYAVTSLALISDLQMIERTAMIWLAEWRRNRQGAQ